MTIKIIPNEKGNASRKLADAELHFDRSDGALDGLKLIGFAVWQRRGGGRNVTFSSRQYTVGGDRRSFAFPRPVADAASQERLRNLVLRAPHETVRNGAWRLRTVFRSCYKAASEGRSRPILRVVARPRLANG